MPNTTSNPRRKIHRGEIYRIKKTDSLNLHDKDGFTIGLVVSQDTEKSNSDAIKVVYLDQYLGGTPNPTHIQIKTDTEEYNTICEYIQTIDIKRIEHYVGRVPESIMLKINQALAFGLGLNNGYNPYGIYAKWEKYLELYPMFQQSYRNTDRPVTRGEIYYVTENPEDPSTGCEIWPNRAAVIVSNNGTNKFTNKVEIAYLSTSNKKKRSKTHVFVTSGKRQATALCEHIYTVDKSQLKQKIGKITENEETSLTKALLHSLDIYKTADAMPQALFREWENKNKTGRT